MAAVDRWLPLIRQKVAAAGLDPSHVAVIAGLIDFESGGRPEVGPNSSGAVGLGQVLAGTHIRGRPSVEALKDPDTNLDWTVRIYADGLRRWGTVDQALAGYLGAIDGKGNITRARDANGTDGPTYIRTVRERQKQYVGAGDTGPGGDQAPARAASGPPPPLILSNPGGPAAPAGGATGAGKFQGVYANPVPTGRVINAFGGTQYRAAGMTGSLPAHNAGTDVAARLRDPVEAPVSGEVKSVYATRLNDAKGERDVNENYGYGGQIVITGDDGREHSLGHLGYKTIKVRPGQRVQLGQTVAAIGQSGNTSDGKGGPFPHLDWEKRVPGGGHEDPFGAGVRFLKDVAGAAAGAIGQAAGAVGAALDPRPQTAYADGPPPPLNVASSAAPSGGPPPAFRLLSSPAATGANMAASDLPSGLTPDNVLPQNGGAAAPPPPGGGPPKGGDDKDKPKGSDAIWRSVEAAQARVDRIARVSAVGDPDELPDEADKLLWAQAANDPKVAQQAQAQLNTALSAYSLAVQRETGKTTPPTTVEVNGQRYIWNAETKAFEKAAGLPADATKAQNRQTVTIEGTVYERGDDGKWKAAEGLPSADTPPKQRPTTTVNGKVYELQDDGTWAEAKGIPAGPPQQRPTTTVNGQVYELGEDGEWRPARGLPAGRPPARPTTTVNGQVYELGDDGQWAPAQGLPQANGQTFTGPDGRMYALNADGRSAAPVDGVGEAVKTITDPRTGDVRIQNRDGTAGAVVFKGKPQTTTGPDGSVYATNPETGLPDVTSRVQLPRTPTAITTATDRQLPVDPTTGLADPSRAVDLLTPAERAAKDLKDRAAVEADRQWRDVIAPAIARGASPEEINRLILGTVRTVSDFVSMQNADTSRRTQEETGRHNRVGEQQSQDENARQLQEADETGRHNVESEITERDRTRVQQVDSAVRASGPEAIGPSRVSNILAAQAPLRGGADGLRQLASQMGVGSGVLDGIVSGWEAFQKTQSAAREGIQPTRTASITPLPAAPAPPPSFAGALQGAPAPAPAAPVPAAAAVPQMPGGLAAPPGGVYPSTGETPEEIRRRLGLGGGGQAPTFASVLAPVATVGRY